MKEKIYSKEEFFFKGKLFKFVGKEGFFINDSIIFKEKMVMIGNFFLFDSGIL